jgi:hypothetical protein
VIIIEEKTSTQDTIEEISIEPQIKQVEIQKTVVKKTISTVSDPIAKSINNTIESTLTQL